MIQQFEVKYHTYPSFSCSQSWTIGPDMRTSLKIDQQNPNVNPVSVLEQSFNTSKNQSRSSNRYESTETNIASKMPGQPVPCRLFVCGLGSSAEEVEGCIILEQKHYRGGYADVWRGKWISSGSPQVSVTIKCLRCVKISNQASQTPEARVTRVNLRLKREVTAWEKLSHPNIVRLLGYRSGDEPLLITPFYENGNLGKYLLANPDAPRLKLIVGAASGLLYLHSFNPTVVHGDIKCDNVLVSDEGEAAFCDFGLARIIQELRMGLTTSGYGQGRKGYLEPELLDGEGKTKASDVFAFGGLILHAVSGLAPFHDLSSYKALLAVSTGRVPSKDQHPTINPNATLWDLMEKCWTMDPAGRPDAREVYSVLSEEEMVYATTGSLRLRCRE
ncbi:hypothetical protein FRB95_002582 [Tulasnella sp. JGI-2019a]|nr:hypothetical protein FRB95_002582 [Tulasnella sp. JGI-2019a]